jgi:hypothetical protein
MTPREDGIAVFLPLVVGVVLTFCTIVIHGLALVAIVHLVRRERRLGHAGVRFWKDLSIVAGASPPRTNLDAFTPFETGRDTERFSFLSAEGVATGCRPVALAMISERPEVTMGDGVIFRK